MELEHGVINSLSRNEITKFLEEHSFAHLGCQQGDEVYVVPITYAYDDGSLYSYSKDGKKIKMLRNNPKVCVQFDDVKNFNHWKSVIAWGKFTELKDAEEHRAIRLLNKKLIKDLGVEKTSDLTSEFERIFTDAIVYKVEITKITGRFESAA